MIQTQIPMNDMRPPTPPSPAVRLTRRQLAKQDELSKSQRRAVLPEPEPLPEKPATEAASGPVEQAPEATSDDSSAGAQDPDPKTNGGSAVKQEESTPEPAEEEVTEGVIHEAEHIVEQKEQPNEPTEFRKPEEETFKSEIETAEIPKPTTEEQSISTAEAQSQVKLETEAPEKHESGRTTPTAIYSLDQATAQSPARSAEEPNQIQDNLKATVKSAAEPAPAPEAAEKESKKSSKPATRKSMNPTDAKSTKLSSRPSVAPSTRSSRPSVAPSARQSLASSSRSSHARSSSVRASSARDPEKSHSEVTNYLASKRRPISISFPAPPPPPKASKPPTRPTFQLPGEAIAAKLKAQKEERLKREAEREAEGVPAKPRTSIVSRAPSVRSSKPPTKSTFQLPGEAVAARLKAQREERLKREAEGLVERPTSATFKPPPPPKSTKPPTKPNFQLPGEAVAAKLKAQREERLKREQEAAEAAKNDKKPAFKARVVPTHKAPATVRQTAASKARESLMNGTSLKKDDNGSSTKSTSKSARRVSSAPSNASMASKRSSTIQTKAPAADKGREVFNRDKKSADQAEKERKEKEEAAKKARAEAAERGRQASREWAERQRKKALAAKAKSERQVEAEPEVMAEPAAVAEPVAEEPAA